MRNRIYFDNAASSPLDKEFIKFMRKRSNILRIQGNPSSVHNEGRLSRQYIERARNQCAQALGCLPEEIFFTSGASESNSWAYNMWPLHYNKKVHDSLKVYGYNTDIHAVSYINNETGNFDIKPYLGEPLFVDLTSAIGHTYINLSDWPNILGASLSGHKFGALQGVGLLYIKKSQQYKMKNLIHGHQENGHRGGTENTLGIISLGIAIKNAVANLDKNVRNIQRLSAYIYSRVCKCGLKLRAQNHILNITFKNIYAETAVTLFNQYGIAISAGSACNAGTDHPSEILLQEGYTSSEALRTVRVSLGHCNTMRECKRFIRTLHKIIDKYDDM